jgi:dipeptidyl aminopeptidase/acylaminoacyl peptidase/predicted Ser/Thr protein kinase
MSLEPGARLGPYQILGPIGAGGMGEVFRARDTRLGREVAIKVLPAGSAADPERRARFEQEARSASALNHPNIITLLDIGDAEGVAYIAMEYVEGKTLRDLLGAGPLPTRKALDIAAQLADGLAKAHAAGILHRDLKPENIMVSKDGFVKILDFGLAKLTAPPKEGQSDLLTAVRPETADGAVVGTVGYMSPEQASGQPVDLRSDQFALGSILYEMVSGARPFLRRTAAETLVAIIREEPEALARLSPRTPAPLRWIVERCLAKDPEERFAATRDLARDLASLREHLSESTAATEAAAFVPTRRRWLRPAVWLAAGLAAGAALGALFLRTGPAANDLRFQQLTFRRGTVLSARFAPDGQSVIYGAAWEGHPPEIYSVRFDGPESRSLGLPPGDVLSVSPSGELAISLGRRFVFGWETMGTLARVPLGGGAPREVLENVETADWTHDGSGLAVARDAGARRRLEFPIGTILHETTGWISNVRVAPDGRRVAFIDHPSRGDNLGALVVMDRDGTRRVLSDRPFRGVAWSPDGEGVWSAGAFTDLSGRVRQTFRFPGFTNVFDVSGSGRILIAHSTLRREIVGLAPGGAAERNLSWLNWSHPEDLSADGHTVLFDEQNFGVDAHGNYSIYSRKTVGSPAVKLGIGQSMALSRDGRWALAVRRGPEGEGLILLPTGAGEARTLPRSGLEYESGSFFPDGDRLLLSGREAGRTSRLFVVALADGSTRAVSPEGVSVLRWRALSPDGRTAVARAPDGTLALYPIEGGEPRPVPGATREDMPIRWTADGRGLYVQHGTGLPTPIEVLDVESGGRRPWRELTPPDPAGVLAIGPIKMSADGRSYVYSYRRLIDDLVVVDGLQ